MSEPAPGVTRLPGAGDSGSPARPRRGVRAAWGWLRAAATWLARPVRVLPGIGALGCAVAGTWLLWGLGWALLAAVPFLLVLDHRTPGG